MRQETQIQELASVTQGLNTSGPGAGARQGDWAVQVVESADIQDDRLNTESLRVITIQRNAKTEKHLLKPYDVLITARSTTIKVAFVPPFLSRAVAGATILVVRPEKPELGLGTYLWYYFTSSYGRNQISSRLSTGSTIASLSAQSLAELTVPIPEPRELHRLVNLIEESERAYAASLEASYQRRTAVRDHIIDMLRLTTEKGGDHEIK